MPSGWPRQDGSLRPYALNVEGKAVYDIGKEEALRTVARARRAGARMIDGARPGDPNRTKAPRCCWMLSRGAEPAGVVGSVNAVWGMKRARPSICES
jgi:hypothetical protein